MRDTAQMKTQHPEWLIKEMDQSAELLDEAAALSRRVEGACTAYIFSNSAPEPHQVSGVTAYDDAVIDSLDGKRPALVLVEGGA